MWTHALIGGAIGLVAGGAIGYLGKCSTGSCPLVGSPLRGAIFGAIIGALIALVLRPSPAGQGTEGMAEDQFRRSVLAAATPVLVDFYADWCAPCRALAPRIAALKEQYAGRADVVKVNVDDAAKLASEYGVTSIPTVMLFVDGKAVDRWVGIKEPAVYRAAIDAALADRAASRSGPTTQRSQ